MSAAEYGRLPDRVIRYGIRRLLKARLDSMDSDAERTLRFLQEAADQPIAVQSQAANEQHYEVPAAFFRQVLGPQLKYSGCY